MRVWLAGYRPYFPAAKAGFETSGAHPSNGVSGKNCGGTLRNLYSFEQLQQAVLGLLERAGPAHHPGTVF